MDFEAFDQKIGDTLRDYDDHVAALQGIRLAELAGMVEIGWITQEQLEQRLHDELPE